MTRDPEKGTPKIRYLSRREMLGLMCSTAAAAALAGCGVGGGQSGSEETTSASTAGMTTSGTGAQASSSTCVVRPQQTEGPYFVDERLNRSDIREDPSDGSVKEGVPLDLVFNVSQ